MNERPSNFQIEEEAGEKKIYPSVADFLSAFEESPEFNQTLVQREKNLKIDHPDKRLDSQAIIEGLRIVPDYRETLISFYRNCNVLPSDLNQYDEEARDEIQKYWNYLKAMPDHIQLLRATSKGKDDEEIKLFMMEKTRDRFHTFAGLALLGDGIILSNGQRITCDEISPEDDSAMDLEAYSVLGRTLVSIITEENGLDIVDPEREEKKTAATLKFLNGLRYSGGHWVAKGES